MGGRGCPECGSHDTEGLGRAGTAVWCNGCGYKWFPCTPGCRGYQLVLDADGGPTVEGCKECGVPSRIARHWPEAYRALANRLDGKRLEPVTE